MKYIYATILLLISFYTYAQKQNLYNHIFGLSIHSGSIFVHTEGVNDVRGARPFGIELEYSKQYADTIEFQKCHCFDRNGIALSYFDFNNNLLGKGVMLSYFIEPTYSITSNLKFKIRGAAGLMFGTNPYDQVSNPGNRNYSSPVNSYLQVGIGLGYKLNKHIMMRLMGNFQHVSNGGYTYPNLGINWVTASLGMIYYNNNIALYKYENVSGKYLKKKKLNIDAGILFVPRQGYNSYTKGQMQFISGVFMQATKRYGNISALTGGTEINYSKLRTSAGDSLKWTLGIHAGHAFILGRVNFSQEIGWYLYNRLINVPNLYYRYGLIYSVSKHFLAGIQLKTHSTTADFTDFRIMYRF